MNAITVRSILLHYDAPLVVTASDACGRAFVGLSFGDDAEDGLHDFAFVQVDRVTMTELLRGELDLRVLVTERCSGLILAGRCLGAAMESFTADVVSGYPVDALPRSGMYLPAELAEAA
jgi:hypothetical protein